MSEQNKSLVRRFVDEIWNKKNIGNLDEFLAPTYSLQTPDGMLRGANEFRQYHENYVKAFPDCKLSIDSLISEGETVVVQATLTGTHKGALAGLAPTGKQVAVKGMCMEKIARGKLEEGFLVIDRLSLYEQLGVAPEAIQKMTRKAGGR